MSRNTLEQTINSREANAAALCKIDELVLEILRAKPTYGDTDKDLYRLEGRQDLALEIRDILDVCDVYTGLEV